MDPLAEVLAGEAPQDRRGGDEEALVRGSRSEGEHMPADPVSLRLGIALDVAGVGENAERPRDLARVTAEVRGKAIHPPAALSHRFVGGEGVKETERAPKAAGRLICHVGHGVTPLHQMQ